MIIEDTFNNATGWDFYGNPLTGVNKLTVNFTPIYNTGTIYQDSFTGTDVIQNDFVEA